MIQSIYTITLTTGEVHQVFCQSSNATIRLHKVVERLGHKVAKFEKQPQIIHNVQSFEKLKLC